MMDFQTPQWVCDIMIDEVYGNPKTILEPTPGEGNLVRSLKSRYPEVCVTAPDDYYQLPEQRFDIVVTNPPFTPMVLGYELLDDFFQRSDRIVALMPWLAVINSEKRYKRYLENGLKKVIHLPRRAFPSSRVQCCILVFESGYRDAIELKFTP